MKSESTAGVPVDEPTAFAGSVSDFQKIAGPNLLDRWSQHQVWWDKRLDANADPYNKVIRCPVGPLAHGSYRNGSSIRGINFASQDYLNLSTHPGMMGAIAAAIDTYGVHSAGSSALMGNTGLSQQLEEELAAFLKVADCTLFSTGWGAGYGIIKALVRPDDHVVIDVLAHACLHEGARSATNKVALVPHLSLDGIERRLRRIRESDARCGIAMVTESLFSMDSDVPDILAIQALCHRYGATLILDVAHDLGAIGADGRGFLGIQQALGKVDVVMGSFSKTFASNGGFVASNHPALKLALRGSCPTLTFSNAITPIAAAIVGKAFEIVVSDEGQRLREAMMRNAVHLRSRLEEAGFKVLGRASAIVPVVLGDAAQSRAITGRTIASGGLVNLVEYPAVARNACRWRLQVMAAHTPEQIDVFADLAADAARQVADGLAKT